MATTTNNNLTSGAIAMICDGVNDLKAVLQVLDVRLVKSKSGNPIDRYRLILSDGVHQHHGMLATQRNDLVRNGNIQNGSILQLLHYVCNVIQDHKIIIVVELDVVQEMCPKIGEPMPYEKPGEKRAGPVSPSTGQTGMVPGNPHSIGAGAGAGTGSTYRPNGAVSLPQSRVEHGAPMQSYGPAINRDPGSYTVSNGSAVHPKTEFGVSGNGALSGSSAAFNNARTDLPRAPQSSYVRQQQPTYQQHSSMYMNRGPTAKNEALPRIVPIAALNPYQGRWTIKARVTAKTELRHYSNSKGEGKVFSFDLLDSDGGEIRVTCFNAVADQFYELIGVGTVYFISKGTLKPAQKLYNHLHNDHEILLDATSVVQPCSDEDHKIPRQQFHFRPIIDIESMDNGSILDVIGIVTSISPTGSLIKKDGTETQKRSLHMKDMSGRSLELTMWGKFCNTEGQSVQNLCDTGKCPVLAVKAARISEFNGKQVGTISSSQLFIEPDFPEAQKLLEWFDREGRNLPSISLSREMTSLARTEARKTLSQIKDEKLGTSEKPDWITVCATLSFIKTDNFCYTACPLPIGDRQCSKKVINNADGKWRCDRCDQSVDECDYRYVLQLQIQDHTGLTWVTAFQEVGEELLGISAKNLYYLKYDEQDDNKFQEILQEALLHKYIFKLKVKEETFSDEQRVKSTVVKAEKVNFVAESRHVLDLINKMKASDLGIGVPKAEQFASNNGPVNSGIGHVGIGQPAYSNGTNPDLIGREMGGFSSNTTQYGNQYSGGYGGGNASGAYATCTSCGGTGHNSTNCPSLINGPGQLSGPMSNQTVPGANTGGASSAQCYKCQNFGHYARDCPGLNNVPPAYGSNNAPGRYGGH